jgi:L-alanine-DL-glutamate epimerase-like enolase superfamily enzyme
MINTNTEEKIIKVEGFSLSSKYGDGNVFGQPKGVKSLGFVEITSESGKKGFGETYSGIYSPQLVNPIVEFLSSYLVGKKLDSIDFIDDMNNIPFISNSGIIQSVIAAIELAILDLIGKINEKPVFKLFENLDPKNEIETYYSGGSVIFSPDEIEKDIETMLKSNFNSFKMRIGLKSWNDDLKRVARAFSIIQKEKIMLDAIMGTLKSKWSLNVAKRRIKDLEKFNLYWLEEPLCPTKFNDYKDLCSFSNIPIAMGEAYSGLMHFENILSNECSDIVQLDATHSMSFRKLLAFSNKTIKCKATHVWGSSLSFVANGTLGILSKNINIHEYPSVEFEISKDIMLESPKIIDGKYIISETPGFGVNIDDRIKNKYIFIKNSGYKL